VTPLEGIRRRIPEVPVTFNDGTDAAAAAQLAVQSQVVVLVVGNHPTCNAGWDVCQSPSEGKEAIDRKSLTLDDEALVKTILAANPHTVVVLQTSFPYTTVWTQEHAPAILEMTHNSEEQGNGLADVLFGDYNPAGRLTQTWPASIDQLPAMMDYDIRHGRTYMYARARPLYAFGFGLSYTHFAYSDLRMTQSAGRLHLKFTLANHGDRDGDEVVQVYAHHLDSRVSRPMEQLVAFERLPTIADHSRQVDFDIPVERLAYWNEVSQRFIVEPDQVEFRVGGSSNDLPLSQVVRIIPDKGTVGTLHVEK
jgi:beta-glucosidase